MKQETKEWLDKLVPLLVHVKEGGRLKLTDSGHVCNPINFNAVYSTPEAYAIHIEPRIIYVNEYEKGLAVDSHSTEERAIVAAGRGFGAIRTVRFIEDLNWKPDLDADHHLPDHTPPHLSKPASDYMKTV